MYRLPQEFVCSKRPASAKTPDRDGSASAMAVGYLDGNFSARLMLNAAEETNHKNMRRIWMFKTLLALVAGSAIVAGAAQADSWKVDPAHSSINFSVKHMVIATVHGKFTSFSGEAVWDGKDLSGGSVTVTAETKSITTDNVDRDKHLRSSDFFAADSFPTITFKSTKVSPAKDGTFALAGDLTIRGVTKPVTFNAELTGTANDPWGNARAGFTAETTINRQDFGVSWSKALDSGGLVAGNDVKLTIEIELVKPLVKGAGK